MRLIEVLRHNALDMGLEIYESEGGRVYKIIKEGEEMLLTSNFDSMIAKAKELAEGVGCLRGDFTIVLQEIDKIEADEIFSYQGYEPTFGITKVGKGAYAVDEYTQSAVDGSTWRVHCGVQVVEANDDLLAAEWNYNTTPDAFSGVKRGPKNKFGSQELEEVDARYYIPTLPVECGQYTVWGKSDRTTNIDPDNYTYYKQLWGALRHKTLLGFFEHEEVTRTWGYSPAAREKIIKNRREEKFPADEIGLIKYLHGRSMLRTMHGDQNIVVLVNYELQQVALFLEMSDPERQISELCHCAECTKGCRS